MRKLTGVFPDQDFRRLGGVKAVGPNPFFTPITTPDIWKQLQQEGWNMISRLFPKISLIFSHPHPDMAECVEPFLSELLRHLRQFLINDDAVSYRMFY